MNKHGSWIARAGVIPALALGLLCGEAPAQMQPPPGPITNWVQIEDSVWISRIGGHDTLDPLEIAQSYVVEMLGDSACATRYTWADCQINSVPWHFYHWHGSKDRAVSTAANLLSWNTRTLPITLHTDDTISFFRNLEWYNPQDHTQKIDGYISRDTLTYTVEMVRTSDSLRVVNLDSIGVMPSLTASVPVIHGMRPIMALVTFVVPASLNNVEVFLRLHLYDRGDGDFFFDRYDRVRLAPRRALTAPEWMYYLQSWGTVSGKRVTDVEATSADAHLDVKNDHGQMVINFTLEPDGHATGIVVYNAQGKLLFYPYLTPAGTGERSVIYRPEASGAYVVGLLYKGKLVRTQKIIITK